MLHAQSFTSDGPHGRLIAIARRLSRFSLIGLSGVGINLSLFSLLTIWLDFHYLAASAVAIELALCSNYLLNNNWTFADRRTGFISLSGLAKYHSVSIGGSVVNLTVLHLLAGYLELHVMLANLAGIALGTGWSFTLNLCWTWRHR